jgi:hypothetical protein
MRETQYRRIHRNERLTAESVFLTPELLDPCFDAQRRPLTPSDDLFVCGGVGFGYKSDLASVQFVAWEGDKVVRGFDKTWRPSASQPVDPNAVETYIRDVAERCHVQAVYADLF